MSVQVGVDEAGRGPLAGPVCAAAVILPPEAEGWGLRDSKRLSGRRREALSCLIQQKSLAWGMGWASATEIDELNILRATMRAMQRAVASCLAGRWAEASVWVDGNQLPSRYLSEGDWPWPTQTLVRGDQLMAEISAASILAKVARDAEMARLATCFPDYGFEQHSGYGTPQHLAVLERLGPCPAHRKSFSPVAERLR